MSEKPITLVARIRKDDDLLRNYFKDIKPSDHAYEIRRLLEKSILIELEEQKEIEKIKMESESE